MKGYGQLASCSCWGSHLGGIWSLCALNRKHIRRLVLVRVTRFIGHFNALCTYIPKNPNDFGDQLILSAYISIVLRGVLTFRATNDMDLCVRHGRRLDPQNLVGTFSMPLCLPGESTDVSNDEDRRLIHGDTNGYCLRKFLFLVRFPDRGNYSPKLLGLATIIFSWMLRASTSNFCCSARNTIFLRCWAIICISWRVPGTASGLTSGFRFFVR